MAIRRSASTTLKIIFTTDRSIQITTQGVLSEREYKDIAESVKLSVQVLKYHSLEIMGKKFKSHIQVSSLQKL